MNVGAMYLLSLVLLATGMVFALIAGVWQHGAGSRAEAGAELTWAKEIGLYFSLSAVLIGNATTHPAQRVIWIAGLGLSHLAIAVLPVAIGLSVAVRRCDTRSAIGVLLVVPTAALWSLCATSLFEPCVVWMVTFFGR